MSDMIAKNAAKIAYEDTKRRLDALDREERRAREFRCGERKMQDPDRECHCGAHEDA